LEPAYRTIEGHRIFRRHSVVAEQEGPLMFSI